MITQKTVNVFGFLSIAVMIIMLILIWRQMVPVSYYMPMFIFALALFIIRIVMRVMLTRRQKRPPAESPGEQ